jgi:glycosyltransferase involved in cell wall biosynthesis
MAQKVVLFVPHNPVPPKGGSHVRCLTILEALADLGCEITLFGSTMLSNTRWHGPAADFYRRRGIRVELHRLSPVDFEVGRLLKRLYRPVWTQQLLTPLLPSPPGMKRQFGELLDRLMPDVVWMNYACWDGLLPAAVGGAGLRVVDTHDLITANMKMQRVLGRELALVRKSGGCDAGSRVLDEAFFADFDVEACSAEFAIYDRYDCSIAVSPKEGRIIAENTRKTVVKTIPITCEPPRTGNEYRDHPIMVLGAHCFNLQGALYFARRVLPRIIESLPSFRCRVTGRVCHDRLIPRSPALILEGFVPDLAPLYRSARFALCPVFGGTGQQVKIVEAMAHGLAVVASRGGAESSPIRHGLNGFIAEDARAFAEYTLALSGDPGMCRKMGECARETILQAHSRARLLEDVWQILHLPAREASTA